MAEHVQSTEKAVQFIESYGEQKALVMPGRITGRINTDLKLLLNTHMTKWFLHSKYEDAWHETKESISLPTWYVTWMLFRSHIVIQKPRTDLYIVCHQRSMTKSKIRTFCDNQK